MGIKQTMDYEVESSQGRSGFFKKGKIRLIVIYEDGFYNEFFVKNSEDYTVTINKRKYFMIAKCVLRGKYSTLVYYFNNPMPINFIFETSKVSAKEMYSEKELKSFAEQKTYSLGKTLLDASTIHSAMTSNLVNKMFAKPWFTVKFALIVAAVGIVIILATLHFTGIIDVGTLFGGGGAK